RRRSALLAAGVSSSRIIRIGQLLHFARMQPLPGDAERRAARNRGGRLQRQRQRPALLRELRLLFPLEKTRSGGLSRARREPGDAVIPPPYFVFPGGAERVRSHLAPQSRQAKSQPPSAFAWLLETGSPSACFRSVF